MSQVMLALDHVLNADHDTVRHSALFSATDGNLFCVHCASKRFKDAPDFRRLAILESISCILRANGPRCLRDCADECLPMLLHGMAVPDVNIAQSATDILLALKAELPDMVDTLLSLVSSTVSLGLPRASNHLFAIGQLLADASRDRAFAAILAESCKILAPGGSEVTGCRAENAMTSLGGFVSFLAGNIVSTSSPDHVKSDLMYVALELLDCIVMAKNDAVQHENMLRQGSIHAGRSSRKTVAEPSPPFDDDPFMTIMLAIPGILERRSSSDEPLQLHSVAYLATASAYCHLQTASAAPGWWRGDTVVAEVPAVFLALFEASDRACSSSGGVGFALRDGIAGRVQVHGDLCGTLKTLLMSSFYRVRTATARLITTLCQEELLADETLCRGVESPMSSKQPTVLFVRRKLIAAGITDYLFEAIKTEQEGTPRHFLVAAEALSLSAVEFFHSRNFSMKFAAPVLLAAAASEAEGSSLGGDDGSGDQDAFTAASRLLLKALVAVPSSSIAGVVEELLDLVAQGRPSAEGTVKAVTVAGDVLSLLTSGDIPLPKTGLAFLDALERLNRHLEDIFLAGSQSGYPDRPPSSALWASSPSTSNAGATEGEAFADALRLQAFRIVESLLHLVEGVILARSTDQHTRSTASVEVGEGYSNTLAEMVFGTCQRLLICPGTMAHRPDSVTHGVAFMSCVGAAVDSAAFVLNCHAAQDSRTGTKTTCREGGCFDVRLLVTGTLSCHSPRRDDDAQSRVDREEQGVGNAGGKRGQKRSIRAIDTPSEDKRSLCPSAFAAASCLISTLEMVVQSDVVGRLLDLYVLCDPARGIDGQSIVTAAANVCETHDVDNPEAEEDIDTPNHDPGCSSRPRELLVEVLESLLFAQGWTNGIYSYDADRPFHARGTMGCNGEREYGLCEETTTASEAVSSQLSKTTCLVLSSWVARSRELPLDHHVISLLGTDADNGNLCKLVLLLSSLSPSYLGILHPHMDCRVDSAVSILLYVKTVVEAVFSLNLFARIVRGTHCDGRGVDELRHKVLPHDLSTAVGNALSRFPVAELASARVPLSSAALSLIVRASCQSFLMDWLIAASLPRVGQALNCLGLTTGCESVGPHGVVAEDGDAGEEVVKETSIAERTYDQITLAGILRAAVFRWEQDLRDSGRFEIAISRLSSILVMAPEAFVGIALGFGTTCGDGEADGFIGEPSRVTVSNSLATLLPETLGRLASGRSLLETSRARNNEHIPRVSCITRVLYFTLEFLRGCCELEAFGRGGGDRMSHGDQLRRPRLIAEERLVRACVDLLQGVLAPRKILRFGPASAAGSTPVSQAYTLVFDLLATLLILHLKHLEGDPMEWNARLAGAFEQTRLVLADEVMFDATGRLERHLDRSPHAVAALLQLCALWNSAESLGRVEVPFEVLEESLFLVTAFPCHGSKVALPKRHSRESSVILAVSTVRLVECVAPRRPFSRSQVLSLQLALQSIACDGTMMEVDSSLRAIIALWKAYAGFLPEEELEGQPWNPFVVECCLEGAYSCLAGSSREDCSVAVRGELAEGRKCSIYPSVVLCSICRFLHRCSQVMLPRFHPSRKSSYDAIAASGVSVELMLRCLALLSEDLSSKAAEEAVAGTPATGESREGDKILDGTSGWRKERAIRSGGTWARWRHRWEATGHLIRLLLKLLPEDLAQGSGGKADDASRPLMQATHESLSRLHDSITTRRWEFLRRPGDRARNDGVIGLDELLASISSVPVLPAMGSIPGEAHETPHGALLISSDLWREFSSQGTPLDRDHQALCPSSCVETAEDVQTLLARFSKAMLLCGAGADGGRCDNGIISDQKLTHGTALSAGGGGRG